MLLDVLIEYLFNTRPLGFVIFGGGLVFTALMALIIAIIAKIFINKISTFYRKTVRKTANLLLYYGSISLFFYFLRLQRIPYLSMRIWLWLWVIGFLLSAFLIIYRELKRISVRHQQYLQASKQRRYFSD